MNNIHLSSLQNGRSGVGQVLEEEVVTASRAYNECGTAAASSDELPGRWLAVEFGPFGHLSGAYARKSGQGAGPEEGGPAVWIFEAEVDSVPGSPLSAGTASWAPNQH